MKTSKVVANVVLAHSTFIQQLPREEFEKSFARRAREFYLKQRMLEVYAHQNEMMQAMGLIGADASSELAQLRALGASDTTESAINL